jgi:hypothetical protein
MVPDLASVVPSAKRVRDPNAKATTGNNRKSFDKITEGEDEFMIRSFWG